MYFNNYDVVHAYSIALEFPEGLMVGGSEQHSNFLRLERRGDGRPVLRGTSVAGVLRHLLAERKHYSPELLDQYFGWALDEGADRGNSSLVFHDVPFADACLVSMHNQIDRNLGSVDTEHGGLFEIERIAPGSKGFLVFFLQSYADREDQDKTVLADLEGAFAGGLVFGGNSNRGMGRAVVPNNSIRYECFDLRKAEDTRRYLDVLYSYDPDKEASFGQRRQLTVPADTADKLLHLEVTFHIPRGQDLLIADGRAMVPQRAQRASDNKEYWKIPGSSLRGVIRSWMQRLYARRQAGVESENLIDELFGTLNGRGRIQITDAYSNIAVEDQHQQKRMHVVIDRFSGGAMMSGLFENFVLTGSDSLRFQTTIRISDPCPLELELLASTLQAIDSGLLRLGSSKAAGRMELVDCKVIAGNQEPFVTLQKGGK